MTSSRQKKEGGRRRLLLQGHHPTNAHVHENNIDVSGLCRRQAQSLFPLLPLDPSAAGKERKKERKAAAACCEWKKKKKMNKSTWFTRRYRNFSNVPLAVNVAVAAAMLFTSKSKGPL